MIRVVTGTTSRDHAEHIVEGPIDRRPRGGRRALAWLVIAIGIFRITLLGRGALAFVDETWYFKSVLALQALSTGQLHLALWHVATTVARPGAVLIRLPIAALQAIPLAFGVAASNPRSLLIVQSVNVGVSLVTLYFFFEIGLLLCGDVTATAIASVVYALLVNTNLYIRHLLPYDLALCAGVGALWLGLKAPLTARRAFGAGLLAGGMMTIYPGYYLLAGIVGACLVGHTWHQSPRRARDAAATYALAFVLVMAATEWLCRAGGVSYFSSAHALSREITTGGAFGEGWTFLPEYLLRVEHLPGLILLAGALTAIWITANRVWRGRPGALDWLVMLTTAGWMWQATDSALWHHMVVYGRLIHPWLLFLGWMLAGTMAAGIPRRLRPATYAVVLGAALISFASWSVRYYGLAYPSDTLYALGIDTAHVPGDRRLCELRDGGYYSSTVSPGALNRNTGYPYTSHEDVLLLNFCQPIGITDTPRPAHSLAAPPHAALMFDGPHWATFPAYGFEGVPPRARLALRDGDYRLRAYRLPDPRTKSGDAELASN